MGRFRQVCNAQTGIVTMVPFTAEEEAARDAQEAAWEADEPKREAARKEKMRASMYPSECDMNEALYAKLVLNDEEKLNKVIARRAEVDEIVEKMDFARRR